MIRFSVNIMRGCFGGCTFCSITEHEGRIIQSRSEGSILREIEEIRDRTPGFTGVVSDLGGPTANMYRLACKSAEIEKHCRRLSCVYPDICPNLNTDHSSLIDLYRKARALPGVKKVLVASGVRYDLAVRDPAYVRELVTHHVGGYLKIAPEHTEAGPLSKMMKPGMGAYDQFKELFEKYSREAGKEQYLIPYFIAAHPGTSDEDMLNLALWLKRNGFRADQVQAFLPSPMALATAMYHSGRNPLKGIHRDRGETVGFTQGTEAAAIAQSLSALPRSRELAAAARGAQAHGPRRSDRQRQAPSDSALATGGHRTGRRRGSARRPQARAADRSDPAHRLAAARRCCSPSYEGGNQREFIQTRTGSAAGAGVYPGQPLRRRQAAWPALAVAGRTPICQQFPYNVKLYAGRFPHGGLIGNADAPA